MKFSDSNKFEKARMSAKPNDDESNEINDNVDDDENGGEEIPIEN